MQSNRCASCGTTFPGAAPKTCPRCQKATAGEEMSLDLKDTVACQHCKFECYEDELKDGACPRCGKAALGEDEEEDEDEEEEGEKAGPRGKPKKLGQRPAGGARPGGKKKRSKGAPPPPPPEKRKVILDEAFKQQVFAAFRRADAASAQQLCIEKVEGNEEHAKQIYNHLLDIAKKKNWIGIDRQPGGGAPPAPPRPASVAPASQQPVVMGTVVPAGGYGADPLPMPDGLLGGAPDFGGALPLPPGLLGPPGGGALPLPPGLLDPAFGAAPGPQSVPIEPPPNFGVSDPTIQLGPGAVAQATGVSLRPPTGMSHTPSGGLARPAPGAAQASLSQSTSGERRPATSPTPIKRQGAPASTPPPSAARTDADPEERGFLGRVAVDGRAAQVSLLCLAGHYAAARDLAQTTLTRDPYSPRANAALGEALAGLGQDAQALQAYTNAVRVDPNDPALVRGYAQVLSRLGRHLEAATAFRRIVGPGKGEARDIVALATTLKKGGDTVGAQRVFEELLRRDPQSLEPVRQQGEALLAAGDLDGATNCLERILAKETAPFVIALTLAESMIGKAGSTPRAALACARAFLAAGRALAAARALSPLVARDPQNVELRRTLGLAYARLGAGPLAEEQLLLVAQRGAAGADEFLALGEVYLERGDTTAGVKALSQAVRARPEDAGIRRALARALAAQGDLEGALRELKAAHQQAGVDQAALEDELDRITERAFAKRVRQIEERLQAHADDAQARLDLAEALAQRGDVADAVSHIERASGVQGFLEAAEQLVERLLEDADHKRPLVLLLARLFEKGEEADRAIAILEDYLASAADDPEVRLALYRCYAAGGRMQDAVVGLRALLHDAPPQHLAETVAQAERLLEREGYQALAPSVARAHRRQGNVDAAVKHFRKHLELERDDSDARHELATLLESAGRVEEAFDALKVVLDDGATTAELERVATLALGAGKVDQAVEMLKRCVDRHPDDLALKHTLEAAEARQRDEQIRALRGATRDEERLRLAALCAEAGRAEQAMEILRALGRLGDNPELSYLRFSAEHFARSGKTAKAEAAMRQVARALNVATGSDQHKQLLYRIAGLYEHAGERRAARRVYLEVHALDPRFQDVEARLEALSEDGAAQPAGAPDARLLELVEVGTPLSTIFDQLQGADLTLDPRLLESFRT